MYATNYFETKILNALRGQTATAPSALYLALYLNTPGETGTDGTEVAYTGYQRQRVTFSTPAALSGGIGVQNVGDIIFPTTPVGLGAITHVGVLDSAVGGNMLLYGAFTEPLFVEASEAPVIVAGEAQWWLTGNMSEAYRAKVLGMLHGQHLPGCAPYLALLHGNPEDGGVELAGGNYARMALAFTAPQEQIGGQMQISNSAQASTQRASGAWGTWSYTAVYDAQTGGLPVFYMPRSAKELRAGMQVIVAEGALNLSVH